MINLRKNEQFVTGARLNLIYKLKRIGSTVKGRLEMRVERRKYTRFCVRDTAFAVFQPEPVKFVPIIDISLGGLGIGVNGFNMGPDWFDGTSRLEILIDDGCFYLDKLSYQILPQYRNFSQNAFGSFQNIYGVKFVDLMPSQQNRLKYFIRHHTRGGMTPKFIRKLNSHLHQMAGKKDFGDSCQNAWLRRPSL